MTELRVELTSTLSRRVCGVASYRGQGGDQSPCNGYRREVQPRGWDSVHDQVRRYLHLGSGSVPTKLWFTGGRTKIYPANRIDIEVAYCVSLRFRSFWRPWRRALAKLPRYDGVSGACRRRNKASSTNVLDVKSSMNGSEHCRGERNGSQGSSK